jgi:hypothetical protein
MMNKKYDVITVQSKGERPIIKDERSIDYQLKPHT